MSTNRSNRRTREELQSENEEIRARLREAEETLQAIRNGEVDAIVVSGRRGEQVFSLTGVEHVYRLIVETMHEAALTVSFDGQVLYCNRQFVRLLRMPPERIVGRRLEEMVAPEQRREVGPLLERSRTFPVTQRLVFQGEGAPAVPVHLSAIVLRTLEGESVCIVATDLSELESSIRLIQQLRHHQEALKKLNETLEQQVAERTRLAEARSRQLQALAVELIRAEEQERRRIGMLLHEDVQQILASSKMRLHALEPHLKGSLNARGILQQVSQLLDESLSRCRLLAQDLSPPALYHAGLGQALDVLARTMKEKHDLAVRVESDPTPWDKLPGMPIPLFLYRAVQELLFNVVKHAGVSQATVRLAHRADHLEVEVADSGRGFDPASLKTRSGTATGFGLLSIEERSRSLGGALTIDSGPGRGSRLRITLPAPGPAGLQEAGPLDGKRVSAAARIVSRESR